LNLAGPPYDLVADEYQLNWPCYKDAPLKETDDIEIDGYTTGADNYIRIYTPVDSSEVGTSQRHTGIAGTGFVLQSDYSGTYAWLLHIFDDYVRVEGLEIDGSLVSVVGINGIKTKDVSNTDSDIRIDKVLIHDLTKNDSEANEFEGHGIYVSDGKVRITNSIIYNVTNNNSHADATAIGIHFNGGASSSYNNTIYNVVNNGSSAAVYGIWIQSGSGAVTATNTYAGATSCSSCGASNYDFYGTITANYNISEDDTADDNAGTGNLINRDVSDLATDPGAPPQGQGWVFFEEIDSPNENFHLRSNDFRTNDAVNAGDDLSGTFTGDIDGETRGTGTTTWDIGADEAADVTLADHDPPGQETDKFDTGSSVTAAELFAFKLTNSTDSTVTVDSVVFQLGAVSGIAQGDFANLEIHVDENNDGTIDGSDTIGSVGGTGVVDAGVTPITFNSDFTIAAGTTVNYILLGDVNSLVANDTVTIGLGNGSVYSYRKKITIDKDKVSGSADLTSFPVLINITGDPDLRTTANGGHVQDADGDDIIFRASDGTTQLDHELRHRKRVTRPIHRSGCFRFRS
jgi:hypothetical protein